MIEIKNLSITYKKTGQKVLSGFSLKIKKGEVVALLGPSGCGKTTFLNYVQGLLSDSEIKVGGKVIMENSLKIRTVFQEPRLLPWRDALANIVFSLEAESKEHNNSLAGSRKILKMVGLSKSANMYPYQLSLGMQQRINFGRALVTEPDLLLMDEPFSSLDEFTKSTIINEFKKILQKKGITTIFVTHNSEEAKLLADKIIKIKGRFYIEQKNIEPDRKDFEFLLEAE